MSALTKDSDIKREVVAAYNEVLGKLKLMKRSLHEEKEEERIAEEERRIIESALRENAKELGKNLSDMKALLTQAVDELKAKILPEYERFFNLRQAISFSEKELEELHDIKVTTNTLTALIVTHKEKSLAFESEMSEYRRLFEHEKIRNEKEREQEEQEYILKRDLARKLDKEQYEEVKRNLENELSQSRRAFEEEFATRESILAAREAEHQRLKENEAWITAHVQEYQKLKEKVANFPEEMRLAMQRAEHATLDRMTRKSEYDIKLLHIELESERKLFQQKIAALEDQIAQYKSLKDLFNNSTQINQLTTEEAP